MKGGEHKKMPITADDGRRIRGIYVRGVTMEYDVHEEVGSGYFFKAHGKFIVQKDGSQGECTEILFGPYDNFEGAFKIFEEIYENVIVKSEDIEKFALFPCYIECADGDSIFDYAKSIKDIANINKFIKDNIDNIERVALLLMLNTA